MSEIKVNSIKGVGASTAAITVNNADGTCSANITNNLSNRRINQNGQMSVWQRGTSITSQGYSPDRYYQKFSSAGGITHTISRQNLTSSDTPYDSGFRYFMRHALSAAGTANAAADVHTQHTIEAQDLAQSGWVHTSPSSYLSISFWVRASTSQKFYLNLRTRDGTSQAYNIPFTPSANTWTKVTAQIPGNANVQIDNDNDKGLHLNFYKFIGTDDTGGSSENAWAAYSGTAKVPDMASTWLTAGASTFDLTGLQVEAGSVATDFEFRTFAQEVALCQRYYESNMGPNAPVTTTDGSISSQWAYMGSQDSNSLLASTGIVYKVTKRTSPTVTIYNPSDTSTANRANSEGNNKTVTAVYGGINAAGRVYVSGCSAGDYVTYNWESTAEL